ncbi:holo-ACP synthase [Campylobacter sp. CX2-8023-23]|uniref:Holo-[acyl-carrier-protein] synthase n=1 Tax=Campylobacter porcelli TaxID=1660073 RepID=A0ABU7M2F9_9BACT|nr:holo-ACP synthase [Campylobacter sp. P0078]MEE3704240.1 holo-ACP synthase [Campylobacter sp. CX2-8023-23]MEE3743887.1 holo-ACP synthase [Campylobacter sp. CX2-4855-23]
MIGIDIVSIDRIANAKIRHGELFLRKFLNSSEIEIAKSDATIAGFWAAKEAISKALGCGIGAEFSFNDATIYKDSKGAPKIKFVKHIESKFNIKSSSLSITHDGGFAIAAVIIERINSH